MFDRIVHPGLYLATIAWLEIVAVYIWLHREAPGAKSLFVCMIARMIWLASFLLISANIDLMVKFMGVKLYYLALFVTTASWLGLALEITGREKWIRGWRFWGLILPLLLIHLLCFFDYQTTHFVFARIWLEGSTLNIEYGPLKTVMVGYNYLLVFLAEVFMARLYLTSSGQLGRQAGVVMAAAAIGLTGQFFWRANTNPALRQDILAVSVLLTNLTISWAIMRLRMFRIRSTALAEVAKNTGDGLIVLDSRDHLVDLNPSAAAIVGKTPPQILGKPFKKALLDGPPALQEMARFGHDPMPEICLNASGSPTYYRIDRLPLRNARQKPLGGVIVLHDITELRREQAKIVEQEKALAVLKESDRLGRELHDGQGQLLGYFHMQLEAARSLIAKGRPDQAEPLLKQLVEITQGLMRIFGNRSPG